MKILIVDDHKMVMEGLQQFVSQSFEDAFVATAKNKKSLFRKLEEYFFDVILLDLSLGKDDSRTFINEIVLKYPNLKIIVISSMEEEVIIRGLLQTTIHGYVGKSSSTSFILEAINQVLKGEKYIDPNLEDIKEVDTADHIVLTRREKEVLKETLKEKSIKEIGEALFISNKTVENHRSNLFQKFHVKNVSGLVKKAIMMGYLNIKDD